ncbi:ribosome silencing factor [Acidobacteriia bacterium AH_259_A11_L15]|nr:ribosome silencing factor [Acidobacteriia bacterium AH_259_A11_L15]
MREAKAREAVEQAARAALDKKAADLVLLDMQPVASFTDYFLLCTGFSARQVQAISDSVEEQLARRGVLPAHSEGYQVGDWVLLDYVDFVVHIFSPRARSFYDIERLWRRAARLPPPADSQPHTRSED